MRSFILSIGLLLALILTTVNSGYAFDSLKDYENNTKDGLSWFANIDNCITSGKVILPFFVRDFDNASIPHILHKHNTTQHQTHALWSDLVTVTRIAAYSIAGPFALLLLGADIIMLLDVCTDAFIMMPNEYVNLKLNKLDCNNDNPHSLGPTDVPFFYHCEIDYDPDKGRKITYKQDGDYYDDHIGKTWGYMGINSTYCNNDYGKIVRGLQLKGGNHGLTAQDLKDKIGTVTIYYRNLFKRIFSPRDSDEICKAEGYEKHYDSWTIKPNPDSIGAGEGFYQFFAYYRFSNTDARMQLCVAAPYTMTPIKVGCSYVPPPYEDHDEFDKILGEIESTRCKYLLKGREDLHSLAMHLKEKDDTGMNKKAVVEFLKSDMHVTSTVVGCVLDILDTFFINPQQNDIQANEFQKVQKNLKTIVFALLTLYITLVGIKIISSTEIPKRGELIMYAIKFALVLFFTVGAAWYDVKPDGTRVGIYDGLVNGSQVIAGAFMQAQNIADPLGYCKYEFNGTQLLSQTDFSVSNLEGKIEATAGANGKIRMTVWDLIDCKVLNYLNMGSCKYSIAGLFAAWMISAAILLGGLGFILLIGTFIYCFMVLKVIFKFTHIFILSMFVLTILVVISPLIICCALFSYTKGIFQKWLGLILGYTLYPALTFAFIALMLATFDKVYYGDIDDSKASSCSDDLQECKTNVKLLCNEKDSAFCVIYKHINSDNLCDANLGSVIAKITEEYYLFGLIRFTRLTSEVAHSYLDPIWHLCLFAFIFYLLMNSVTEFIAYLTGVLDVGGFARGDLSGALKKGAKTAGQAAKNVAKMAAKTGIKALGAAFSAKTGGASNKIADVANKSIDAGDELSGIARDAGKDQMSKVTTDAKPKQ